VSNLLQNIHSPEHVKQVSEAQLPTLAAELRNVILKTVSKNGGHLASNLGSVELTIELLRIFSPPADKIIWDVGHQSYSWKLLTGRYEQFHTLRKLHGISGFPKPHESIYDASVAGHAGTALSTAMGFAAGRDRKHENSHVVAIIGDASITNGISLEALNNLEDTKSKVIVILNDNKMSIDCNVGALSRRLGSMLTNAKYNQIKAAIEAWAHKVHLSPLSNIYHRIEHAIKSIWLPNTFFEGFGLRYIGPIDGHDFRALNNALRSARDDKRSVLVHVITQKGRGFEPAEESPSHWHGVGPFTLDTCEQAAPKRGYSKAFGETLTEMANHDSSIMAITAAMCSGTGLESFAEKHPTRFFDVGICESHAVVFAAGLAASGFRPYFAVYSSFLQRAIDCIMHDVCIQNLPVTFCIDRAGIVGSDGPTHHGVFDIPMLRCLPNLTLMQPADEHELAAMLKTARNHNGPCAIRYPRDPGPELTQRLDIPALPYGKADIRLKPPAGSTHVVWIWALGDMLTIAMDVAALLAATKFAVGVVNARFIKPIDKDCLLQQCANTMCFVTLENGTRVGGFGSALAEALEQHHSKIPVYRFGWRDAFQQQGSTQELMTQEGLTPDLLTAHLLTILPKIKIIES